MSTDNTKMEESTEMDIDPPTSSKMVLPGDKKPRFEVKKVRLAPASQILLFWDLKADEISGMP